MAKIGGNLDNQSSDETTGAGNAAAPRRRVRAFGEPWLDSTVRAPKPASAGTIPASPALLNSQFRHKIDMNRALVNGGKDFGKAMEGGGDTGDTRRSHFGSEHECISLRRED